MRPAGRPMRRRPDGGRPDGKSHQVLGTPSVATEVKGRVFLGLGWHLSTQQLFSEAHESSHGRFAMFRAGWRAWGSGRSDGKAPATSCAISKSGRVELWAIARNASAHEAQ